MAALQASPGKRPRLRGDAAHRDQRSRGPRDKEESRRELVASLPELHHHQAIASSGIFGGSSGGLPPPEPSRARQRSQPATGGRGGAGVSFSLPPLQPRLRPSVSMPLGERGMLLEGLRGGAFQDLHLPGFYLVKFAVSVTALYLAIQSLINFAEVLLPFIFAVLCVIVLEPLKRLAGRVFHRLAVNFFSRCHMKMCLEECVVEVGQDDGEQEGMVGEPTVYGRLPGGDPSASSEDVSMSTGSAQTAGRSSTTRRTYPVTLPIAGVRKLILASSIIFCIALTGRMLWLMARVLVHAASAISEDIEYYKLGASRIYRLEGYLRDLHVPGLEFEDFVDDIFADVANIGSIVTKNVLFTGMQAVVTFIFLLYMLWSPIKVEGNTMVKEVFVSTERYLKVKCAISAFAGLSVAIVLACTGLDLPVAFGLLSFLANFLPGIGSIVASLLPCILAVMDVRKTPGQVLVAFLLQLTTHFAFEFFVEPIFFGISVEIHSVVVILGIYFFYQVWGVPGMLLSVPTLAVLRITMKSMRHASLLNSSGGTEADTLIFLDGILEGRWMSTSFAEFDSDDGELEMVEVAAQQSDDMSPASDGDAEALQLLAIQKQRLDLWAAMKDNRACREARSFYQQHNLLVEASGLLALTVVVFVLL